MTSRIPRIFYVGQICTDAYVKMIQEDAFVGAASGKMSSVVSALRLAGQNAILVSLPFVGRGSRRQPGRLCRGDGFPALFLPVRIYPVMRKALGIFSMAWFAMRRVRQYDTILFYNHGIEFFFALVILRFRGISVFQDIEDVPTSAEYGLRGFINRFGFSVMFKLSSARKVTVSNEVGNTLHLRDFLAIPGIAVGADDKKSLEKWAQLDAGGPLIVHYGGTLMASTGLEIFCAAVAQLDAVIQPTDRCIKIIVTGIGDLERVRILAKGLQSDKLFIEVYQGVSRSLYLDLLDSSHASLSLKNPNFEISRTTFPSKVIEITSRGISLIATRISDVGDIFNDDEAWLLPQFTSQALTDILLEMVRSPAKVKIRADAGKAKVMMRFAPLAVGRALAEFLKLKSP